MITSHADPGAEQLIDEFFAVTLTSIYRVRTAGDFQASAVKIALDGDSIFPLGEDICQGGMVAIGQNLQGYAPRRFRLGHAVSNPERRLELVGPDDWMSYSSYIVTLFLTEAEATECFRSVDRKPLDPRWIGSTKRVIEVIGDEHPSFYVPRRPNLALLPEHDAPDPETPDPRPAPATP